MMITPTDKGALVAGIGMWILFWVTLFHLDKMPWIGPYFRKDKIMAFVNRNSTLVLIFTEIVNFGIHGVTNPSGVIFALGGTIVNGIVTKFAIPFQLRREKDQHRKELVRGIA